MPPFVMRVIRHVWRRARGLGSHTFEGCYPSIDAATSKRDGYEDDAIAALIVEIARRELASLAIRAPMNDDSGQLLLPMLLSGLSGRITVLDFGAGPARGLINILRHVPRLDRSSLRYIIIETESARRAFASSGLELEVISHIPETLAAPLIINAGSSIQYVSEYRILLKRLAALAPDYFVISQTPFSDSQTYARVQLNIPHKRIAQWVFNRKEFVAEMELLGYALTFTVDHDLPLTHARAPGPSQMVSMIFRRAEKVEPSWASLRFPT
jgi:putative methyltransferase (TIGR04325 family)